MCYEPHLAIENGFFVLLRLTFSQKNIQINGAKLALQSVFALSVLK